MGKAKDKSKAKVINENDNAIKVNKNKKYKQIKNLKSKSPQPQPHSKNKEKNKKMLNSNKNKTQSTQPKSGGSEEKSNNLSSKSGEEENFENLPTAPANETFSNSTETEKNERTIFIGNLPSNIKKIQLKNLLLPFGKMVKCRFRLPQLGKPILKHKMAAKSKSLNAYVELSNRTEVINSLKLNGTDYKNHHLRVSESVKKFDSSSINQNQAKRTVFVGNLKYEANDELLYEVFSTCGDIEYCRTLNNEKGCKGVAYVCFTNLHSVGLAIELNGTLLHDRPIKVIKYSINKIQENSSKLKKYDGVVRRIGRKLNKDPKKLFNNKKNHSRQLGSSHIGKQHSGEAQSKTKSDKRIKSEFQGVHVNSKKKFKSKLKKNLCKDLANKIAPK